MSLLHVFLLSIAAYLVFKMLAPMILNFVATSLGVIGNATLMNSLLFGAIFVGVYKLNQEAKVLQV